MVVIHQSLGGRATLQCALVAARRELREGGLLAVFGENRLRITGLSDGRSFGMPRATGWGFRWALARAGFTGVSLYVTHPSTSAPVYVIDTHRRSARAFFRAQLAAQGLPRWSPKRLLIDMLVAANLMPYLQPEFIVVGHKC